MPVSRPTRLSIGAILALERLNKEVKRRADDIEDSRAIDRLESRACHLDVGLRLFHLGTQPDEIAGRRRRPRRTEYYTKRELSKRVCYSLCACNIWKS